MLTEVKILDTRLYDYEFGKPATLGSAAFDLRACVHTPVLVQPGEVVTIPAGFAMHLANPAWAGLILPRSGSGSTGLVLANTVGLIDSDYQGPILLKMHNRTRDEPLLIQPMTAIAQMLIVPIGGMMPKFVDEFSRTTQRGQGGFGSTGA